MDAKKNLAEYLKDVDAARQENIRKLLQPEPKPEQTKLEFIDNPDTLESVLKKIQRAIAPWLEGVK